MKLRTCLLAAGATAALATVGVVTGLIVAPGPGNASDPPERIDIAIVAQRSDALVTVQLADYREPRRGADTLLSVQEVLWSRHPGTIVPDTISIPAQTLQSSPGVIQPAPERWLVFLRATPAGLYHPTAPSLSVFLLDAGDHVFTPEGNPVLAVADTQIVVSRCSVSEREAPDRSIPPSGIVQSPGSAPYTVSPASPLPCSSSEEVPGLALTEFLASVEKWLPPQRP